MGCFKSRSFSSNPRRKSHSGVPSLVFSDDKGNIMDFDSLEWAGKDAGMLTQISSPGDWIEVPPGSELFTLKMRKPIGYNR